MVFTESGISQVLINGEKRDRAMVKSSLEELQKAGHLQDVTVVGEIKPFTCIEVMHELWC